MAFRYQVSRELENHNSSVQSPVGVPHYATFQFSTIASNEFLSRSITIEETTHQIFLVTRSCGVRVFSETGEFIYQLGVGRLKYPYGIAIHRDSVYVSCQDHTVSKFSLIDMSFVVKVGGRGSGNGQFDYPSQLTTDTIGRVFIADSCNDRICIHDNNLKHLRNISHESISQPSDVKVSHNLLYVLCSFSNPCMHVLTLEGEKLQSLIPLGQEMDVLEPYYFCLDPLNNFVLSVNKFHSIRVFSSEGNLLHTIGGEKHRPFAYPTGVAITPNGRLVFCVSLGNKFRFVIY